MHRLSRRTLLAGSFAFTGLNAVRLWASQEQTATVTSDARPAGEKSDTRFLQNAIDAMQAKGGGTVHIAAGRYVCGSLLMRSKVSLWLDNGATLAMSEEPRDFFPPEHLAYNPHADRGTSDFRYALLVGDGLENVAIFGDGVIDCDPTKRRGPKPIAMRRCNQVRIEGITIRNASSYNISLLGCDFVAIDGVTIQGGLSDGIDPDCCRHVRISNCSIESVDDAICLKTSGSLGERRPTEDITVDNCILRTASIHFKCGTESCGDFRDIAVSNCIFEGGMGMRHGNPGIALYTTDGGALDGVVVSNIEMRDVDTPLAILRGDRDSCGGDGAGVLQSVQIANVVATGAKLPSVIAGYPGAPVSGIGIDGFSVGMAAGGPGPALLDEIPERPAFYPDPTMFGALPACGLFLRHVEELRLRDFAIKPVAADERPLITADDVSALELLGFTGRAGDGRQLWLRNARDSVIECVSPHPPSDRSYRISGRKTSNLTLKGSGRFHWDRILELDAEVRREAIRTQ